MKRILSIILLFGLTASNMPMRADSKSQLIEWAKKDSTQTALQHGYEAVKHDAKALGAASLKLAKAGYNALPAKETVLKSVKNGLKIPFSAASNFIENNPGKAVMLAGATALAVPLIAGLKAASYDENQLTAEQKELREINNFISQVESFLYFRANIHGLSDYKYSYRVEYKRLKEITNYIASKVFTNVNPAIIQDLQDVIDTIKAGDIPDGYFEYPTIGQLKSKLTELKASVYVRMTKLDKSITPGVVFGTIATVSLPLIVFAKWIGDNAVARF